MTDATAPEEMKNQMPFSDEQKETIGLRKHLRNIRKAIEAHAPLNATNVNVERVVQSHNIDTDVETVRVELTYEIKRTA